MCLVQNKSGHWPIATAIAIGWCQLFFDKLQAVDIGTDIGTDISPLTVASGTDIGC